MQKSLAVLNDFEKLVLKDAAGRWCIALKAIQGDQQCGDDSQWLSFCSEQFGLFFGKANVRLDAFGLRVTFLREDFDFVGFVSSVSEFNRGLTQTQFEEINGVVFDRTCCVKMMSEAGVDLSVLEF